MATLYFKGLDLGGTGDWSNISSWYTSIDSSGTFVGDAGRVPNATDNVIICGTLNNISNEDILGGPNYVNPISIQLGYLYDNIADGLYQAFWDGSNFSPANDVNVSTIINVGPVNDSRFDNTNFWAAPITTINDKVVAYNLTTLNVNDSNCSFEGVATVGTANFYNESYNGGNDTVGTLYGTVNFYQTSSNGNQNNGNEGVVIGTANFYNNSSNFDPNNGTPGTVNGTANFYNNSQEVIYNSGTPISGTIIGTLNFKSTSSLNSFLSNYTGTSTINYAGSGGGSVTSILLTELLKLPFPIVI